MVSIKHIQEANRSRSSDPKTAVFVGATSGIGLGAIEALLKSIRGCTVFIVGRSESKFAPTLSRLQQIDPTVKVSFMEAQVSLLNEVRRACMIISKQIGSLDILWLSQGGLGLREGQGKTIEGLPMDFAVSYYGRVLFMRELAPLLGRSPNGCVLSVLCAGMEGRINSSDPGLQQDSNYAAAGFWGAQKHGVAMQSLAMHQLATRHPDVTFIHTNPGAVSTDVHAKWSTSFTGAWTPVAWLIRLVMVPLMSLVAFTPEQAGEIGLYEVTEASARRGTVNNFLRLDDHAEEIRENVSVLPKYQQDGTAEKIWKHTQEIFDSIFVA